MAQPRAAQPVLTAGPMPGAVLYKPDRPRWIDRYIDFFGNGAPARLTVTDLCGETVLDWPA
jgi:hypothetical protein